MSEMVDRVARGIMEQRAALTGDWAALGNGPTPFDLFIARAAIRAMREPAGGGYEPQLPPGSTAAEVWNSKIDAALVDRPA